MGEKENNSIKSKTSSMIENLKEINGILLKIDQISKSADIKKCRSMILGMPNRIEFEENCLKFYIDFTVTCQESKYPFIINGSIIYGTSRTMCFKECPREWTKLDCQRNVRCDCLEDKPLIEFMVGDDGLIKSSGILEGEWIIEKEELTELHYRTLVIIWKDALDWSNEKLIP